VEGTHPRSRWRRLDPVGRYGLRLTLVGVALAVIAIPFTTLLFDVLAGGPVTRFDGQLANAGNDLVAGDGIVTGALRSISWLGRAPVLAVVVVGASLDLLRRHQRRLAAFLVLTAAGGGLLSTAVKLAVDRPRPVVDHPVATAFGSSFPSGHALASVVVYGALLLTFLPLVPRGRRGVAVRAAVLLVVAIGLSRLLLGVHFLSDVVGGWLLGLAWLLGAVASFEAWRHDEGARPVEPLDDGVEPEVAEGRR